MYETLEKQVMRFEIVQVSRLYRLPHKPLSRITNMMFNRAVSACSTT